MVDKIKLRGTYDPKYFSNKYHGDPCNILFVERGLTEQTTVNEFFSTFGHLHAPEARAKLKVTLTTLHLSFWFLSDCLKGLAPGETFPDKVWRTLRCVHSRRSILGHHDAERSS